MWGKEDVVRKRQVEQEAQKLSLRQYARPQNVSAAYLSDVYLGRRDPGPMLLEHLGLERKVVTIVTYVKRRMEISKVLVNFIQDRSGSMQSVWDETLNGLKSFVNELRDKGKHDGTVYLFSLTPSTLLSRLQLLLSR